MKLKKRLLPLVSVPVLLLASNALAVDIGFVPRADIGYFNYNFEWSEQWVSDTVTGSKITVADLTVNLMTGSIGGSLLIGKFYLDVYAQQSLQGSDEYTIEGWSAPVEWDVDVFDYALTAGYNVWSTLAIFGGWKGHKTSLEGLYTSSSGLTDDLDYEFETDGFFLGMSYGFILGDAGVLSFNGAYAWMNGDFSGSQTYSNGTTRRFRAQDGDSGGFRVGMGWKGYFTDALSYNINADWYSYNYDDFKHEYAENEDPFAATDWNNEIDETAYSLRAGISYAF